MPQSNAWLIYKLANCLRIKCYNSIVALTDDHVCNSLPVNQPLSSNSSPQMIFENFSSNLSKM